MSKRVPTVVSDEEHQEWQEAAKQRRMTLSELIRQAVRKEIQA